MRDTSFAKHSTATRIIAAIERGWRHWSALQVEAAQRMFQRAVDPLTGRTAPSQIDRSRYY